MKIPTLKIPYLSEIKRVYICMLAVYAVLRDVIPLYYFVSNSILSVSFFVAGILLIAADVFSKRDCFRSYCCDFLVCFILICIVSTCINYAHSLGSNLKAIGWMLLYYFLLYPNDSQKDEKTMFALFHTVTITMTVLILISIPMYLFDVGYTYHKTTGTFTDQGFSFLYARLWGVFHEANYAAIFAEIALFMSVYLAVTARRKIQIIFCVFQNILYVSFIVLSGSRTAMLVLLLAGVWLGAYGTFHFFKGCAIRKTAISSVCGILTAVMVFGIFQMATFAIPYVKKCVRDLTDVQTVVKVHGWYDAFYERGYVDIAERSFDRLGIAQAPEVTVPQITKPTASGQTQPTEETLPAQEEKNEVQALGRTDLGDADISNGRFRRWKEGLQVFCAAPVLGASPRGVTSFAKIHCPETYVAKYSYSISNSVIDLLASTGIIGTVTMLAFLLLSAIRIIKNALTNPFSPKMLLLSGLVVVTVASSILESDLFFLLTMSSVAFWFVLGSLNGNAEGKQSVCLRLTEFFFKKES